MLFMVMNQLIRKDSGTANFQKINSNIGLILPKPVLWFQLYWVDLIIVPLIMMVFRFNLQLFHLNITINLFQI